MKNKLKSVREIKGWLLSLAGILILFILTMDFVNQFSPKLVHMARWIAWVAVVVGALEAMQVIRIFNYSSKE